jgi:hypothetical protein
MSCSFLANCGSFDSLNCQLPHPVRLQPVRPPDPLHRGDADADRLGHGGCPMRRLARRIAVRGERDNPLGDLRAERRNARRPRLVAQQPVHARLHEPFLPAPDGGLALRRPPYDFVGAVPLGGQKHDPRSPDVLLRAVPIRHHRFQTDPVGRRNLDDDPLAHAPDSHTCPQKGICRRTLPSGFIH